MTRYVVQQSDHIEIDRAEATEYFLGLLPEYAALWDAAVLRFMASLADFPGPKSYAVDQKATRYFGRETRRALFYGPTRKRSGTPYRVYFTVVEPETEDEYGVIYVLRVLHGSRQPIGDAIEGDAE